MTTNVKATSVQAYRKTAPQRFTQRSRIAQYILSRTRQGKPVWRKDIVRALELEASTVAGRVNEIEQQGIEVDGQQYRLQYLTNGVKDPVTGKTVEAFALVLDSETQLKFDMA